MKKRVFLGLSLGGIKSDKSSLISLDYFPKENRLVLSNIFHQFKDTYPDEVIKKLIRETNDLKLVGVDFPITLPPCITCKLSCPGVKKCDVTEVKWLKRQYQKLSKDKKIQRLPSPYSERGLDYFISKGLEEDFPLEPSLGGARASFYGRGVFLKKGLKGVELLEVFPKASLWRIGLMLGMRKSVLRNFYKSGQTDEFKKSFLKALDKYCFIYEDDFKKLLMQKEVFESLLCALSVYYYSLDQRETLPAFIKTKGSDLALPQF